MSSHDIITPGTNAALHAAAEKYTALVPIPHITADVNGFASVYLETMDGDTLSTLVVGNATGLAVSAKDHHDVTKMFVNIDLSPDPDQPAKIVRPGFYNANGALDTENGTFLRRVLKPLTETQGRELTMDLHAIIARERQYRAQNQS